MKDLWVISQAIKAPNAVGRAKGQFRGGGQLSSVEGRALSTLVCC